MIRGHHLIKRFGDRTLLSGVDLSVDAGEVVGLMGPRGVGKTVLARILTGQMLPDEGAVLIAQEDVHRFQAPHRVVGFVPEHEPIPRRMRVRDYIRYFCGVSGARSGSMKIRLADLGKLLDPLLGSDRLGKDLNPLEMRIVGLVRANLSRPKALVFDEPFSGLDAGECNRMATHIREAGGSLARSAAGSIGEGGGRAIVVMSREPFGVELVCHRLDFIRDGRIERSWIAAKQDPADLWNRVYGNGA